MLVKETANQTCKKIIDYLEEYAKNDLAFKQKLETTEQTNEDLHWYIMQEARKFINGSSGYITDEVVYGWAIHFIDENIQKPIEKPAKTKKPTVSKASKPKAEEVEEVEEMTEEVEIEEAKPKPQPKKASKKPDLYGGMSLFDL